MPKMKFKTLDVQMAAPVAVVWLNRPEVRNAFNETLVGELTEALDALDADASVRAVAIAGRGPAFCAGGDLNWTRRLGAGALKAIPSASPLWRACTALPTRGASA
jgi:methylglutaconyl-CoA hydratase